MLHESQLDNGILWNIVKKTRHFYLSQYIEPKCDNVNALLGVDEITDNIDSVEKELELNSSYIPSDSVSYETIQTAGEMFVFLNYCPPTLVLEISHLFKTRTPNEMILALTSIKKHFKQSVKDSGRKILSKVMESFQLEQYQKIQIITKGICNNNGTFENCTSRKHFTDEDLKFLG